MIAHSSGIVFYFHGLPGSSGELGLFSETGEPDWFVPDRTSLPDQGRFDVLAQQIRAAAFDRSIRLIGFSLGAYVALEAASRLPDYDVQLELVSPAGPLQLGDLLDGMAGKAVFTLMAQSPVAFRLLMLARPGLDTACHG